MAAPQTAPEPIKASLNLENIFVSLQRSKEELIGMQHCAHITEQVIAEVQPALDAKIQAVFTKAAAVYGSLATSLSRLEGVRIMRYEQGCVPITAAELKEILFPDGLNQKLSAAEDPAGNSANWKFVTLAITQLYDAITSSQPNEAVIRDALGAMSGAGSGFAQDMRSIIAQLRPNKF